MKESIAQTFLVNLIIFFFGILILLYFGSINYSKAFKCKNRIVTIIEKYGGKIDDTSLAEIESNLQKAGYQTSTDFAQRCHDLVSETGSSSTLVYPNATAAAAGRGYSYCIIRQNTGNAINPPDNSKACVSSDSCYYQVVTFMEFNVPLFGGMLRFPVRGETVTFSEISS